ncbi:MAG: PIN domain-containing protein [Candidatus Aenigmarchaeota archaeon]|nr:PIN domain-containing protein [Candidatus Aenigmarchaeota archaeon]
MPYADTDFLLALLKPGDWLKEPAEKTLNAYEGTIWTSIITIAEAVMVGRNMGLNAEEMVSKIVEICKLSEDDKRMALQAAVFISRHGLSTFDAFHAAFAANDAIISSDSVFDKIGLKRINLR